MASRAYQNRRWLHFQYLTLRKSPEQIAEICEVSQSTIYRYIEKFGLKR